jgi:hypothetical protein
MEAMAQEWTDGRLDELSGRVDQGFERVDRRFEQVDRRFEQVDAQFAALIDRLDSLQRTMIQAIIALTAAILTGFIGICGVLIATL